MELYAKDKKAFAAKSEQWLRHCPIDAKIHAMLALALTEPSQAKLSSGNITKRCSLV
jgi:hypothetical protein